MRYVNYQPSVWDMLGQGLMSGFSRGQEKKQQEEENAAAINAYIAMKKAEANSAINPAQTNLNQFQTQANTVDNPVLSNALGAALGGTDQEKQQAMTQGKQFVLQGQDLQMTLDQAKARYSPQVFDSLAPFIGKVNPSVLIQIAENIDAKRIKAAEEKTRTDALKKAFANPNMTDSERAAILSSVPGLENVAARFMERAGGPQQVSPGTLVRQQDGSYKQIGQQQGQQVQLQNGNIGVLYPDGTVKDTGQAFYTAPRGGGGGGSATGERYVNTPLGKMTVTSAISLYKQSLPKQVQYDDNGIIKTRSDPGQPEIVKLLKPVIGGVMQEAGVDTRSDNISQEKGYIAEAIKAGAKPEQIRAKVMQRVQSGELSQEDAAEILSELPQQPQNNAVEDTVWSNYS